MIDVSGAPLKNGPEEGPPSPLGPNKAVGDPHPPSALEPTSTPHVWNRNSLPQGALYPRDKQEGGMGQPLSDVVGSPTAGHRPHLSLPPCQLSACAKDPISLLSSCPPWPLRIGFLIQTPARASVTSRCGLPAACSLWAPRPGLVVFLLTSLALPGAEPGQCLC